MDDELRQLREGGEAAVAELFSQCRDRLARMVRFRLDPRLRGRADTEDVLQDAYVKIAARIGDYVARPTVSFYVWARQITRQTLIDFHRVQMGQKRDPKQEVRLRAGRGGNTSYSITLALVGQYTSPSAAAVRKEQVESLHRALDAMDETDREVLALRHFEQLTNKEVAEALDLSPTAASNRYVRALQRLGEIMGSLPDFQDASQ
jgi:RNA polymerase sigma-70 factor, ECF subfamily